MDPMNPGRTSAQPIRPRWWVTVAVVVALILAAAAVSARAVGVGMLERGSDYHNRMSADPKRAGCTPIRDRLGDEWVRAEGTKWQGRTFDLIGGGSRVVGPDAMVSVGGTTYVVWPCAHGVGTS